MATAADDRDVYQSPRTEAKLPLSREIRNVKKLQNKEEKRQQVKLIIRKWHRLNFLLESFDEGVIDEDEFLLLNELHFSKNPEFLYKHVDEFDFNEMDEYECMAEFRCKKSNLEMLGELLNLPPKLIRPQGSVCSGIEGLYMLEKTSISMLLF